MEEVLERLQEETKKSEKKPESKKKDDNFQLIVIGSCALVFVLALILYFKK